MLPRLFGIDSKGKERFWEISWENDTVTVEHGCVDGKSISSSRTFEGKNIGRKNETLPEEQARLEAEKGWITQVYKKKYQAKDKKGISWCKKIREAAEKQNGVTNDLSAILRGEDISRHLKARKTSTVQKTEVRSTQSQKWEDRALKYFDVKKGVWIQPKYDGVRVIALLDSEGETRFISRGLKEYPHLNLLKRRVGRILSENKGLILDGELYAHSLCGEPIYKGTKVFDFVASEKTLGEDMKFDVIAAVGKPTRSTPHPLEDQLQFNVFDVVADQKQSERIARLETLFSEYSSKSVIMAPTIRLSSLDQIQKYHEQFTVDGYEGTILRAESPTYEQGKRSLYIRKYKDMQDAEFEIVGSQLDSGVDKEFFVFILKTDSDTEFRAKPMGTRERRLEMYSNRKNLIGSYATVKFQKLSKDGIPIFGVVKGIRETV